MKIVVLNVHKHRKKIKSAKVALILLTFVLIFAFAAKAYIGTDNYLSAMSDESEKNLVIIDAGHGGEDPGAIGATGVYEKDLNLSIAKELGAALEAEGFAVVYTRTDDKLLYTEEENVKGLRKISDLKNRCKIAEEYPSAIFISIHMNSFGESKYSGLQVYYGTENENSQKLATNIQKNVAERLQPENKRVIKAGKSMFLTQKIQNPCVLVECGFVTNADECKKLSEKEYQKSLSSAIVCGIIEYRSTQVPK